MLHKEWGGRRENRNWKCIVNKTVSDEGEAQGIQGVLRTRGESLTQDGGRKGGQEQSVGQLEPLVLCGYQNCSFPPV